MVVEITKGVAVQLTPTLTRAGVREDFTTAQAVKACVTDTTGATTYITDRTQSADAPDADWRNGDVTIAFSALDADGLPNGGTVNIHVKRYDEDVDGNDVPTKHWKIPVRVVRTC